MFDGCEGSPPKIQFCFTCCDRSEVEMARGPSNPIKSSLVTVSFKIPIERRECQWGSAVVGYF